MTAEINAQQVEQIKHVINQADWRPPERTFMHVTLIFMMMSLIIMSCGIIFGEAIGTTLFGSISILSLLSMIGCSLQIYSYTSDTRGY